MRLWIHRPLNFSMQNPANSVPKRFTKQIQCISTEQNLDGFHFKSNRKSEEIGLGHPRAESG